MKTDDKADDKEMDSESEAHIESEEINSEDVESNDDESKDDAASEETDLNVEIEQLKGEKLQVLADFQNYKRRTEVERYESQQLANKSILDSIIELVDDFNRATSDKEAKNDREKLLSGYGMILDKIKALLSNQGLEQVEVKVGDKFDPEVMEALGTAAVTTEKENDTVIHVDSMAYKLSSNKQIYKTAKVIIGKFKK